MLVTTGSLSTLRTYYVGDTADLMRVAMNARSLTEANLAFELLRELIPEKACVAVCNVREVLRELPIAPFAMRVDEPTLVATLGLTAGVASLEKHFDDDTGYSVLTAGNLVMDLVVHGRGERFYWNPSYGNDDLVDPGALDIAVRSDRLLPGLIELADGMGLVCNPKFYLSTSDWHLEHASDMFNGLGELF